MIKRIFKKFHNHYHFKYKKNYRHAKKLFVFDISLILLAIAMFGSTLFFFFWQPGITNLVDLHISLGNDRIISGNYITMTIDYKNRSEQDLTDVNLVIDIPRGFLFDKSNVDFKANKGQLKSQDINTLLPIVSTTINNKEEGKISISGWLWTDPSKEQKITAYLTYTNSQTNKTESKIGHYLLKLNDSVLKSNLRLPKKAFFGQIIDYSYELENSSDRELNVQHITNSWNAPDIKSANYQNITLKAKEKKTVTGKIDLGKSIGIQKIKFTPWVGINMMMLPQIPVSSDVTVYYPDFYSQVGFSKTKSYADIFSVIPLDISWKNNSDLTVDNLQLVLTANYPNVIDWAKTAKNNNVRYSGNSLIIDSKARAKLKDILPKSGESFTINLQTTDWFGFEKVKNGILEITPEVQLISSSTSTPLYKQKGTGDKLPIATQLGIRQQVRFYTPEGDQIGRLPLPPKVGQETKYWIFVKIYNQTNDITDAKLTAKLADGVTFTGKESVTIGPKLTYEKSSNILNWTYSRLSALSTTGIYFEVQVTPTESQIGQKLDILEYIKFFADDDKTTKTFSIVTGKLDNKLMDDDQGKAKGYLVEE